MFKYGLRVYVNENAQSIYEHKSYWRSVSKEHPQSVLSAQQERKDISVNTEVFQYKVGYNGRSWHVNVMEL